MYPGGGRKLALFGGLGAQPGEAVRLAVAGWVRPGTRCGSSVHVLGTLGLSLDPRFSQLRRVKIAPASRGSSGGNEMTQVALSA